MNHEMDSPVVDPMDFIDCIACIVIIMDSLSLFFDSSGVRYIKYEVIRMTKPDGYSKFPRAGEDIPGDRVY